MLSVHNATLLAAMYVHSFFKLQLARATVIIKGNAHTRKENATCSTLEGRKDAEELKHVEKLIGRWQNCEGLDSPASLASLE